MERAARSPRTVGQKTPPPCKGGTSQASADEGPTGLGYIVWVVDLGLRSQTRFSPGFHIKGFQPLEKVNCQNRAEAILRCRHSTENSEEPSNSFRRVEAVVKSTR